MFKQEFGGTSFGGTNRLISWLMSQSNNVDSRFNSNTATWLNTICCTKKQPAAAKCFGDAVVV